MTATVFLDEVEIFVLGGRGGDGCVSFRREKYVPRGGPDGGDGGNGGSVILAAEEGVDHLTALGHRHHWRAEDGQPGRGALCQGRSGKDLIIPVPPGTLVFDAERRFLLKDLREPGDRLVAARGGKGGKGNASFKSATNRAPRQCTPGEDGEVRRLRLELRMVADVGLVGKPNAGKSTLLSRLSKARPEIAAYPFTTKYPHLGKVVLDHERSFVLADIPGLIEGAHAGAGLGHEFLRHVQRAAVLLHLVEPEPYDGSDPLDNYRLIREEMLRFDSDLAKRAEVVAVTKADLPACRAVSERLASRLNQEVIPISAVTGENLNRLVERLWDTLRRQRAEVPGF
ncbi:MAG: GTPase ObgE [Thermogutta sp.]